MSWLRPADTEGAQFRRWLGVVALTVGAGFGYAYYKGYYGKRFYKEMQQISQLNEVHYAGRLMKGTEVVVLRTQEAAVRTQRGAVFFTAVGVTLVLNSYFTTESEQRKRQR
jgi:hypothetical protein